MLGLKKATRWFNLLYLSVIRINRYICNPLFIQYPYACSRIHFFPFYRPKTVIRLPKNRDYLTFYFIPQHFPELWLIVN